MADTVSESQDYNGIIRNFWQKIVQAVVQSREGEKQATASRGPRKGSSYFNVEIEDNAEVHQQCRKQFRNVSLSPTSSYNLLFLIKTKDMDEMLLEIWTLSMKGNLDLSSTKIDTAIFERFGVLLKSCLCVSRMTPAYKLSFRQGADTFITLYGLPEDGNIDYKRLGDDRVRLPVGHVNISKAQLVLTLTHRVQLMMSPHSRIQCDIMLKSDHFKCDVSPKPLRKIESSGSSGEIQISSDSNSSAQAKFRNASPLSTASKNRSRTTSEGSGSRLFRDSDPFFDEPLHTPFATDCRPKQEDIFGNMEFNNLLISTIEERRDIVIPDPLEKFHNSSEEESPPRLTIDKKVGRSISHNISIPGSNEAKEAARKSASLSKDDYVMVMPFVGSSDSESDLGTFYREIQAAPPLKVSSLPDQGVEDLSKTLAAFELCSIEHDELVASLDKSSEDDGLD